MSARTRGQETAVAITVSDDFLAQFGLAAELSGSFIKVREFSATPRIEQSEEPYLGEDSDDLDQQLNGYDLAFTVDELDAQVIDFLSLIAFKETNKLPPPVITISATTVYRNPAILARTEVYLDCVLKQGQRSFSGRKEYVNTAFEAKAREREVIVG